ncbi:hypothetical protein K438DRAFT_1772211 [Mycena galopus ATCC 62051]|nr:hypothetical protein K438DRAFT_1772211 [Mycena galopus ATCC 62051]
MSENTDHLPTTARTSADVVVKCSRCKFRGPLTSFPRLPNLKYTKDCHGCREKHLGNEISVDENESDRRVFFSEARQTNLKRCFDSLMTVIEKPGGVHPKMAKILEAVFDKVEKVGGNIRAKAPTISFSFAQMGKSNENGNKCFKKPFKPFINANFRGGDYAAFRD